MKYFLISLIMALSGLNVSAQTYISSGKITYERKVNLWAGFSENFFQSFKSTGPQWQTDSFTLVFTGNKSLYQPDGVIKEQIFSLPARDNIVYTDFRKRTDISVKSIFGKEYLIENNLRNTTWKIKDDFREIAGFNCRRATTIIMDSVFVVAFYSEEIIPSAGPESFTGLPGTILGLVINRLHTSWYATRVEITGIDTTKILPPTKGIPVEPDRIKEVIKEVPPGFKDIKEQLIWAVNI